jgi:membrane protein required for colicin V production
MDFNYFDLIAASIILLLGLKGIINGFFKELFGLLGIIGGIFIASRLGNEVGQRLSDLVFKFDNSAAINFTGFLVTFAAVWISMILIGAFFTKLSAMSGLGIMDKLLGFVFGASKFFLIASVIAYATYNIKAIKSTLDSSLQTSVLFPVFVSTGAFIMKMDPAQLSKELNSSIDGVNEKIKESVDQNISDSIQEIKDKLQGKK